MEKYLVFNSLNMVIIAVIGGFALALALTIIQPLQAQLIGTQIYWLALVLFGIIIIFAFLQFFVDKRRSFYQKQL